MLIPEKNVSNIWKCEWGEIHNSQVFKGVGSMDWHWFFEGERIHSRFFPRKVGFSLPFTGSKRNSHGYTPIWWSLGFKWLVHYSIFHKAFHYFSRCFWNNFGNSFHYKLTGLQIYDWKKLPESFFFSLDKL